MYITPYDQPDLNDLTFNTKSFYERKAKVQDKVEFYMLLEPSTLLADYPIDRLQFRLPEEYQFPAIKTMDNCVLIGKVKLNIQSCSLSRVNGSTYVDMIPSNYDHVVKIVRISALG
jgi:hypothetical protein